MSPDPIEKQMIDLQPKPSQRFYRRMARAAWTPAAATRHRIYAGAGITIIVAAALFIFSPQGRALAQKILYSPTASPSLASPTIDPGSADLTRISPNESPMDFHSIYPLTIAQAQEQAGFTVLEPASMPANLSLIGASYESKYKIVHLFYLVDQVSWAPNQDGLTLSEQQAPDGVDCELCGFVVGDSPASDAAYGLKVVGANATIESVQIGDSTGQYVEGGWGSVDDTGMEWMSDSYFKTLRWQANGIAFELQYWGEFSKYEMVVIAKSIK